MDRTKVIYSKNGVKKYFLTPNIVETVLRDYNDNRAKMFEDCMYIEYPKEKIGDWYSTVYINGDKKRIIYRNIYPYYDDTEPHTPLNKYICVPFNTLKTKCDQLEREINDYLNNLENMD